MKKILLGALTFFCLRAATAQTAYSGSAIDLVISGTSTLHDWDMKSAKANTTASFTLDAAGHPTALTSLSFSTPVNSLKSEHSAMDNNAYKALKNDKNPAITYTMTSASFNGANVNVKGRLTIAGSTRDEDIDAVCKSNPDNTITVTGTKKISMKDFNMQPPTFMLGAVKTGNDIVLKFNVVLKKI